MRLNYLGTPVLDANRAKIRLRKLFELSQQRNEWIDWDGATDVINRGPHVAGDFDTVKKRAEALRKPGTHFLIRCIPVFVIQSDSQCLLVGEKYTNIPMSGLSAEFGLDKASQPNLERLVARLTGFALRKKHGFVASVLTIDDVVKLVPVDELGGCFHFESVPSSRSLSLGWKSSGKVDIDQFHALMTALRRGRLTK